jgi:uncharacterized coiled-coil DUF342 family protein
MRVLYFFLASALLVSMQSCTPPDRTGYVKQIDSISNVLENVAGPYEKLNLDELQAKVDTVNKHLDFIQDNYKGEYRSIRKIIPEFGKRRETIANGLTVSREQLSTLKKALSENSTHDAVGNEIDDEYLKKQIQQEKTINAALVKEIEFIVQKSDSINNRFARHYNQAKFWCDSIAAASK